MLFYLERVQTAIIQAHNLAIDIGEIVSLSGPSGCGKSQFLKAIADLVENEGTVTFQSYLRDSISAPDWRAKVTYVASQPCWWADKVAEHFQNPQDLTEKAPMLGLDADIASCAVSRLSTGQAQRLSLLRALENVNLKSPRLFLLDEPTSALDQESQMLMEQFIRTLTDEGCMSVLIVSHDPAQIKRFAHRRWEIKDTQVQEVSP